MHVPFIRKHERAQKICLNSLIISNNEHRLSGALSTKKEKGRYRSSVYEVKGNFGRSGLNLTLSF